MGKLLVRQRLLSFADKFDVTDEFGQGKYYAQGKVFSWGKNCVIMDAGGREVAKIEQRVMSWMPKFQVFVAGELMATIQKEFSFLRPRYHIDFGSIQVVGDPWRLNYSLEAQGQVIGAVNKKFFTMADTYEIEVYDDSLELLILALVLSIDYVKAQQSKH